MTARIFTGTIQAAASQTVIEQRASELVSGAWSSQANTVGFSNPNASAAYHSKYQRSPFRCVWNSGAIDSMLDYNGRNVWDAGTQTRAAAAYFGGGGTNNTQTNAATQTIVKYDPVTDTFEPWQGTTANSLTSGLWWNNTEAHNFDSFDIDPAGNRLVRVLSTPGGTRSFGTFNLNAPSDSNNAKIAVTGGVWNNFGAASVDPIRNAVVMFRNYFDLEIYSLTTGALTQTIPSGVYLGGRSMYHNGFVYYAGSATEGSTPSKFYRLSSTGSSPQALGDLPAPITSEANFPNYGLWGKLGNALYMFHSNGTIYRCDLSATTPSWTSHSTIPTSVVGTANPGASLQGGFIHRATFCPIESAGVFLAVFDNGIGGQRTFLWKP